MNINQLETRVNRRRIVRAVRDGYRCRPTWSTMSRCRSESRAK